MQDPMTPSERELLPVASLPERRTSRVDISIWLAGCLMSSLMIAVVRWPTFLGIVSLPWLRTGHDFPWRIWWRARNQFVNSSRHVPLYFVMGGALAIVFIGTGLICWLLLTHSSDDPTAPNET